MTINDCPDPRSPQQQMIESNPVLMQLQRDKDNLLAQRDSYRILAVTYKGKLQGIQAGIGVMLKGLSCK